MSDNVLKLIELKSFENFPHDLLFRLTPLPLIPNHFIPGGAFRRAGASAIPAAFAAARHEASAERQEEQPFQWFKPFQAFHVYHPLSLVHGSQFMIRLPSLY